MLINILPSCLTCTIVLRVAYLAIWANRDVETSFGYRYRIYSSDVRPAIGRYCCGINIGRSSDHLCINCGLTPSSICFLNRTLSSLSSKYTSSLGYLYILQSIPLYLPFSLPATQLWMGAGTVADLTVTFTMAYLVRGTA